MTRAMITGGTAGIGAAFARRYAADGYHLVLVARDAERLAAVADSLRAGNGVEVEILVADLASPDGLARVADRLRDDSSPVDVLVNNAGFGPSRRFLTGSTLEEEVRLLDVLVRAVLVLTHAAIPGMVARGRGQLVTVSSVAGFGPTGSYAAAKSWATTFSRSLAVELTGTGVRAIAVCPGLTRTEFHSRAGIDPGQVPPWMWLDPDQVVDCCLRDIARGRTYTVPGLQYRTFVAVVRHLPMRLQDAVLSRRRSLAPMRGQPAR